MEKSPGKKVLSPLNMAFVMNLKEIVVHFQEKLKLGVFKQIDAAILIYPREMKTRVHTHKNLYMNTYRVFILNHQKAWK